MMARKITTYEQAIEYLYGRINYERARTGSDAATLFKLDRMRHLLARLGDPQEAIPAIHIAGTKGKGTTAAFVAGILESAGFRVGLYTSPHISAFEERLQLNGEMPAPEEIVSLCAQVAEVTDQMDQLTGQMSPTFFEITMALGWLWFRQKCADAVVLEVGLGGRLDATNVCRSIACAITSISRDHTSLLGSTLAKIAKEKAGIVKPRVPLVSGVKDETAQLAIERICREQDAPLVSLDKDITITVSPAEGKNSQVVFSVQTPMANYQNLTQRFAGQHQLRNAALAVGLIDELRKLGWSIGDNAIRKGLALARCPLRIEVLQSTPWVILDVAHNWASVSALLATLESDFPAKRKVLIFAASQDKDVAGMLRLLAPKFDTIILTRFAGNPRGVGVQELSQHFRAQSGRFAHLAKTPSEAWQIARKLAGPDDLICGTGSFFIAAELREQLIEQPQSEPLQTVSTVPAG